MIDVGLAGVVGADRITHGEDLYSPDFSEGLPSSGDVRGDTYGPVNYLAYVPFEQAFPWSGRWDDVPAARAAALGFDLLTALALFALGSRLRRRSEGVSPMEEGRTLGLSLAFAWLAYPFTLYTLGSQLQRLAGRPSRRLHPAGRLLAPGARGTCGACRTDQVRAPGAGAAAGGGHR